MRFSLLSPQLAGSFWRLGVGQLCSYGMVAAAAAVGAGLPAHASGVLGPVLLAGLLALGIAHGACDQWVLPAHGVVRNSHAGYLLRFTAGYVGLAATIGLLWWRWPGPAVGLFFALTAWHWGSADAPAHPQRAVWVSHSLLRGTLLFALPAWRWPIEAGQSVNGLLELTGAGTATTEAWLRAEVLWVVLAGHAVLWAYFAWQHTPSRWHRDAVEVVLLAVLFVALPPLLALGVYFVFWHSLQHILRLTPLLGYAAGPSRTWQAVGKELVFFGGRAWPMLLASLLLLAGAYAVASRWLPAHNAWLGLAVLAAAVITLPHALLVTLIMDAAKWHSRARTAPRASALGRVSQS